MVVGSDRDIKIFFAGVDGKRESLKSPSIYAVQCKLKNNAQTGNIWFQILKIKKSILKMQEVMLIPS